MFVGENWPKGRTRSALLAGSNPLELGYGRFMQTDPLGYDDGLNWYNYVGNDPVNKIDPSGMLQQLFRSCSTIGGTYSASVGTTSGYTVCTDIYFDIPDRGNPSIGIGSGVKDRNDKMLIRRKMTSSSPQRRRLRKLASASRLSTVWETARFQRASTLGKSPLRLAVFHCRSDCSASR